KNRIQELQAQVQTAKTTYATALRNLERISDDIHRQRGDFSDMNAPPPGPREPGVGAELNSPTLTTLPPLPDFKRELEKCDYPSIASSQVSLGNFSHRSSDLDNNAMNSFATMDDSEGEENEADYIDSNDLMEVVDESDLEALRQKVKILAVRPIEGGDGQQEQNDMWEHELNATVNKLDHLMLLKECANNQQHIQKQQQNIRPDSLGAESIKPTNQNKGPLIKITSSTNATSMPVTPEHSVQPLKKLNKLEPLPSVNVSMRELPLLARLSTEVLDRTVISSTQRRRSLD
ncbi:SH3 domain-binding protein 5 homolog, partial [Teleopsis dalmanni]